jgi:hypothetical protein
MSAAVPAAPFQPIVKYESRSADASSGARSCGGATPRHRSRRIAYERGDIDASLDKTSAGGVAILHLYAVFAAFEIAASS